MTSTNILTRKQLRQNPLGRLAHIQIAAATAKAGDARMQRYAKEARRPRTLLGIFIEFAVGLFLVAVIALCCSDAVRAALTMVLR